MSSRVGESLPAPKDTPAGSGSNKSGRRCWECLRRRLVCDLQRPACNKCVRAGVTCPGYGQQKPLTWLTPGKVKSKIPVHNALSKSSRSTDTSAPAILSGHNDTNTSGQGVMFHEDSSWVPRFEAKDLVTRVIQAINFYNTEVAAVHTVKDMWTIPLVDVRDITTYSPCFAYGILVFVTEIVIVRRPSTEQSSRALFSQEWLPLHQYRLELTKALNEDIGKEKMRFSRSTLEAITLILSIAINGLASAEWQLHYRAMCTLINTQGGFRQQLNGLSPPPDLYEMLIIGYAANCTTPPLQQLTCLLDLRDLDIVLQAYNTVASSSFTCPALLYAEVIRINDLRMRKALLQQNLSHGVAPAYQEHSETSEAQLTIWERAHLGAVTRQQMDMVCHEARALLERVLAFQLDDWAREKDAGRGCFEAWLRQGRANKSAVVIFAVLSLPMPPDEAREDESINSTISGVQERTDLCAEYAGSLAAELTHVLQKPSHLGMSFCWPAIALGVSAAGGRLAHQSLVTQFLLRLGREHGSVAPYKAKEVLEQFWASGKTSWDECFDRPYAFFT